MGSHVRTAACTQNELLANMVLNLVLIWHWKHVGLALATSLSAFLNAGLLFLGLKRPGVLKLAPGSGIFLLQVAVAVALMGIALHYLVPEITVWLSESFFVRLGRMVLICLAGALTYVVALMLLGVNPKQLAR